MSGIYNKFLGIIQLYIAATKTINTAYCVDHISTSLHSILCSGLVRTTFEDFTHKNAIMLSSVRLPNIKPHRVLAEAQTLN